MGKKKHKTLNVGKIRKCDEENVFFFRGKNVFIFQNCFFTNWEGAKYFGGSRPSFSNFTSKCEDCEISKDLKDNQPFSACFVMNTFKSLYGKLKTVS